MGISVESRRGRAALLIAHCAGMIDLVALSVWVGALITHYGFDAQQAGGLPTLFLSGAVIASAVLAPRFLRLPGRWMASAGFALAAVSFWMAANTQQYGTLAALHVVAGLAAGAALSVTHGTIARSANPHRLFALAHYRPDQAAEEALRHAALDSGDDEQLPAQGLADLFDWMVRIGARQASVRLAPALGKY